ncbi:MAG: beta-galactosidase [Ignisphaera sp.]|uniref:beta-galactosidase n=1 Tax=Ignisphaera aggregans TaxID=334771 RepID=A0A7C4JL36_9CREN
MESKTDIFTIHDKKIYFMCSEIHYFRVPKALWYDRLLKAKRAGLNCVASYIAWNWHEPFEKFLLFGDESPGSPYDSTSFSRDLENYIKLIQSLNMYFIARPGPYICSEWDSGGHPNWLYTKNVILRSLEANYIKYTEKWYNIILPLIAKFTVPKGGPVALLQIENEYYWGDIPYHLKLYELAKKYIDDIPIVTNENYLLSDEDPIINTIDSYPSPWEAKQFDEKIKRYMEIQRLKPKMFMELEGGWFSTFGDKLPTNRGSFPSQWTEILLKTSLGFGINGINIYMFHGGTNLGFYTGKYITTTYDYDAAIREWGELSSRYYTIKRFAYFIKTFNNFVVNTKPVDGLIKVVGNVDLFVRADDKEQIIAILRNVGEDTKHVKLIYKNEIYPYTSTIRVPSRNAKIVLVNYTIEETPFRLIYTSSEPLILERYGDNVVLIVYGDPLELGETAIESAAPIEVEYSKDVLIHRLSESKVDLSYIHSEEDKLVVLKSNKTNLYLLIVSRDRANKTWLIDDVKPSLILISNLYFVGKTIELGNGIELELEVDAKSCGNITLISAKPIATIKVDGREVSLENIKGPIYRFYNEYCKAEERVIDIEGACNWRVFEDPLALQLNRIEPKTPLEFLGNVFNGYSIYTIEFKINEEDLEKLINKVMYVSNFNDYASVTLNNRFLASDYHSVEVDAFNALREGVNKLTIIVESTGHTNDGLVYIPNGVVGDIYLGKVDEKVLIEWKYIPYKLPVNREFSLPMFLHNPVDVEDKLKDLNFVENATIVPVPSSPGIYVKEITITKKLGRYILDLGRIPGNYYRGILMFVNKKFVGLYKGPTDLTDFYNDGVNEIALLIMGGITLSPKLKIYQKVVEGDWMVRLNTEGLAQKLYSESVDDSTWRKIRIPTTLRELAGKILWIRGKVNVKLNQDVSAPLKLILRASGIRALIYFNGHFIGRFADEGPQTEFYIPEPVMRNGENNVAIMIYIVNNVASIDYIAIAPYFIHRKAPLEIIYM